MKAIIATIVLAGGLAQAGIPSLINYQGRLTDTNGQPVTGSRNFAISIYDAASSGNLLYTESLGALTLDTNGVYSFQFGSAGTSNKTVSETVATTDGTSTMFQKVLTNTPAVAGSVSVADGTYTWSQSGGSSNEDDFGCNYSSSLSRITVNYYNGAPAAGRTITSTYRYATSGIDGALASGAEHWMAVSVDGVVQGARQRVLAVPFAKKAGEAVTAGFNQSGESRISLIESQLSATTNLAENLQVRNQALALDNYAYRGQGLPDTANCLWDSFVSSQGWNGSVAGATEGAFYSTRYNAFSWTHTSLAEESKSAYGYPAVIKNLVVANVVHRAEAQFRSNGNYAGGLEGRPTIRFNYSDGTNSGVDGTKPAANTWVLFSAVNPNPSKTVSSIDFCAYSSSSSQSFSVKEAKAASKSPITITCNIHASNRVLNWTKFRLSFAGSIPGGSSSLIYAITNGSTTQSGLGIESEFAWNGSTAPTQITLTLTPSATELVGSSFITTFAIDYKN